MTTNTYDALNQLTGETFADTTTSAFTYDPVGNLLTALDDDSSYTYVYDSLDRKTQYTDNILVNSVLYAHDPVGRLTSKTGPEGDVVTYAYDAAGRMISLAEGAGTSTFTHDAQGNTLTDIRPNAAESQFTYDAAERVLSITHNGILAGAQTVPLQNINPVGSSNPHNLTAFCCNRPVLFAADDGTNGIELWVTDGTEAGTFMAGDINPSGDSSPAGMEGDSTTKHFSADDGTSGRELWSVSGPSSGWTAGNTK